MIGSQSVNSFTKQLDPNELVLMFDGSFKAVKDLKPKDLLMGDDSHPCTVLDTKSGEDNMYKIVPINGESYVVSGTHVISLHCSHSPSIRNWKERKSFNVYWMENGSKKSKSFKYEDKDIETIKREADIFASTINARNQILDITL